MVEPTLLLDEEIVAAVHEYRAADEALRDATERAIRARKQLIAVLNRAGVSGLHVP